MAFDPQIGLAALSALSALSSLGGSKGDGGQDEGAFTIVRPRSLTGGQGGGLLHVPRRRKKKNNGLGELGQLFSMMKGMR